MSMTALFYGLLLVLAVSLVIWTLETFWLLPRRQAALIAAFRSGALSEEGLAKALGSSPMWVEQARWGSSISLLSLLALAMLGRMEIDFSLVLVIATLLCGLGWGLDILLTRRRRRRHAEELAELKNAQVSAVLQAEPLMVEYAHSFFPVLAIVLVLRSFLVEPFTIPSGSMLPTLEVGDYILVNKYAYGIRLPVAGTEILPIGKPQRGDVMVFRYPPTPTLNFIKRVVGVPGDHIRTTENGDLYVNHALVSRKLVSQDPEINPWQQYFEEDLTGVRHATRQEVGADNRRKVVDFTVPAGHYFMMGDNRDNSRDSRYWGPVPERLIVGKAVYLWVHKDPGLHLPTFTRNGSIQ